MTNQMSRLFIMSTIWPIRCLGCLLCPQDVLYAVEILYSGGIDIFKAIRLWKGRHARSLCQSVTNNELVWRTWSICVQKTYPTMGFLNPNFKRMESKSFCNCGCGLIRKRHIWPIHQTIGFPWSRVNLGAMSSGIDSGMNGGRGCKLSTIGSSTTCIFSIISLAGNKSIKVLVI
jgi:hypothetical protein